MLHNFSQWIAGGAIALLLISGATGDEHTHKACAREPLSILSLVFASRWFQPGKICIEYKATEQYEDGEEVVSSLYASLPLPPPKVSNLETSCMLIVKLFLLSDLCFFIFIFNAV